MTQIPLTQESAICDYLNINLPQNHILVFKMFIYKTRNSSNIIINIFLRKLSQVKDLERTIVSNSEPND